MTRIRGMVLSTIIIVLTMGVPWWWSESLKIPDQISITSTAAILWTGSALILMTSGGLYYLRRRTLRSLDIKQSLHSLSHYLRDYQSKLYDQTQEAPQDREAVVLEGLSHHLDDICNKTMDYFKLMTHDSTVNAAIRIAVETDGTNGGRNVVYRTLARSSGLSRARTNTTSDVPANRGIPRYLIEKRSRRGILRYNNLVEAERADTFFFTENERLYPDEVKTMFVAPINGWDGKQENMIGILYVTSRDEGVFKHKHVDSMRFVADMIAPSLAFAVQSTLQRLKHAGTFTEIRRVQ